MPYMDKLAPEIASILPTILPKGGPTQEPTKGVVDFKLSQKQLEATKKELGISPFIGGQPQRILDDIYKGLKVRDAPDKERKINIIYEENNSLIREPATVLKDGKADCDEVTRTAYLLAWESGVRNITMVEMSWTEKTDDGERRTGHSFIILMPQSNNENEQPRIYDLTYYKKGKPLQVGSDGLEAAIKREYASDAANHGFGITMRGNLNEVEATHYDRVGEHYNEKKNWRLVGKAYERAAMLMPSESVYGRDLAAAYSNQDNYAEAIPYYIQCLKSKEYENNPEVHAELGVAYANTNRKTEAKGELEKALSLGPNAVLHKRIDVHLAVLYAEEGLQLWKQDEKKEALELYEKAHNLDPNNKNIEKDYKLLKQKIGK